MGEPLSEGHRTVVQVVELFNPCKHAPLVDEERGARGYLPMSGNKTSEPQWTMTKTSSVSEVQAISNEPRLSNLAKLFSTPGEYAYRDVVYEALRTLISSNVLALTYSAVFGTVRKDYSSSKRKLSEDSEGDAVGHATVDYRDDGVDFLGS
jgi:hypothetical protein